MVVGPVTVPILLDVDGMLNVLPDFDPTAFAMRKLRLEAVTWPEGTVDHVVEDRLGRKVTLRIRPETTNLVARLSELGPIVWCTSWGSIASDTIAPLVGLPTGLPWVALPDRIHGDGPDTFPIKAAFVRQWAADEDITRLVWLDDDLYGAERYLTQTVTPSPRAEAAVAQEAKTGQWRGQWNAIAMHTPPLAGALCVQSNPHIGLADQDVAQVERWLAQI